MLERVAQVLKDYRQDDDLEVTAETTFAELAFDSLDTVEIVMNLEEEFGVTIEMDENIKSVGDLMKVIEAAQ